jgi:hypothetical protein
MRLLPRRRRWVVIAASVLVALGASAAIAYATIPDSEGVIHGCYKTVGGALRVINTDEGGACLASETSLAWNQTGPQGEPGPPGQSVDVVMSQATGTATAAGQEVVRQIPLTPGAYTLHATVTGSNSNAFAVVLDCTAYSSAQGTGIGYEGQISSGIDDALARHRPVVAELLGGSSHSGCLPGVRGGDDPARLHVGQ